MKTLLIMLLLISSATHAQQVYKWVDENGEVHYSQTLPPERAGDAHDRLTSDGLVAERIDRVKTGEELAALKQEQQQQREEAELQKIQAQQDRLFLAAYPAEEDVRRFIEIRRETVTAERNAVESLIEQSRARFAGAVEQAAALERRGEPVPESLVRRIDEARDDILNLNERLAEIDSRLGSLDEELAAELERHRRLSNSR